MSLLYGPVPSRRLGRSLGVDLVPYKTCSYDCIYCQLGRTTHKTVARRTWTPPEDVLRDLPSRLASRPDVITLGGSGEPTLYAGLGELIDRIKAVTDVPVAVLTNGSLLGDREVSRDLRRADLVVPSLDAGDETTFQAVNRPHPEISYACMLEGLAAFRRTYAGRYWLEVFIVGAYTDTDAEAVKLAEAVGRIRPDRVQLNTATRPPAEADARAVPAARLRALAARIHPDAEVIADFRTASAAGETSDAKSAILDLLARRPCTLEDIAAGLGLHRNEIVKHLDALQAARSIRETRRGQAVFFQKNCSGGAPPRGEPAADRRAVK